MKSKFSMFFSVAALLVSVAISAPALALDNNPMGSGKTKDELVRDGYTCTVVTATFTECTKSGSPTYWCTGQTCEQAPARSNPRHRFPNTNLGNQILSR